MQIRSAGSWLAGFSYQGGRIRTNQAEGETDNAASATADEGGGAADATIPDVRVYVGHFGIGGGYGYNWVLGKKWLLHFSMLPTFVIYNRNNMTVNDVRKKAQHIRFNMIFNERASIVHNFSSRYFAGVTLTMNSSVFDDDAVTVNQNKWRARAFFAMRL